MNNIDWYNTLNKPLFSPPDWIFLPTWIFLYITIGISLIFFLKTGLTKDKISPLGLFFIQLFFNFLWTPLFFGEKNIFGALIIIIFLLVTIILTMIGFYRFSKFSALILIPYLLWVIFAAYLNFGYWILNR